MTESHCEIRNAVPTDHDALLALNAANVPEVGPLDDARLALFFDRAPFFKVVEADGTVVGLLVGLTEQDTWYPSRNYGWFAERYDSFAYIDRVALCETARGRGLGPALYTEFETWARSQGRPLLCAEVNTEPPNLRSSRFHQLFGFVEVGRFRPYGPDAEEAMLVKPVAGESIEGATS